MNNNVYNFTIRSKFADKILKCMQIQFPDFDYQLEEGRTPYEKNLKISYEDNSNKIVSERLTSYVWGFDAANDKKVVL